MLETTGRTPPSIEMRFDGKVAIISGASSGNGRAIACRFAAEGASVVCGDVQREPRPGGLDGTEPTDIAISNAGATAEYVAWDVADAAATQRAFRFAVDHFGTVDIVVANAGIGLVDGPLDQERADIWSRLLRVNLTGTWNTVRVGLRTMIEQGREGRIVTLSSAAGLIGIAGVASGYAASKAAIIQLTRQAAVDGAPHGITANAVCPGYVRTAINTAEWMDPERFAKTSAKHPLGRMGETSDIAGAVAFLASPDASWITGVALPVDGGLTLI
jgi:NAD(P)-dependent dehydrogenase (short-subunit alcohol dehydrogenase family)